MGAAGVVGSVGRVTRSGAIRPGRLGEVLVTVDGSAQAYLARDADGGAVPSGTEIVVVELTAPRTVLVTPLHPVPSGEAPTP